MQIKKTIQRAVERVVGENIPFVIEHPSEEGYGEYASNVALVMWRSENLKGELASSKNSRDLAEKIRVKLEKIKDLMEMVGRIEVAGEGFVNFYLKEEWLLGQVREVIEKEKDYGRGSWGRGRRVLFDYSAPNIAKDFSVGHLRSTIIGQAIRNLFEFSSWKSVGDNHLGDWGVQFGMIIAAVERAGLDIEKMSVGEMEKLYVEFNKEAKENPELREKAKEAFVRLESGERVARRIWSKARSASMKEFDRVYELLGVRIEYAHGESRYIQDNLDKQVIEEARSKGLAYKSEGALVIDLGDDLPVGMLLKSDGGTTYFTRDLATIKFRRENQNLRSDLYVYEVGVEQSLHLRQVFAAAERLGWGRKSDYVHVAHGLVLGEDGKKMSTRKGTGIKMEELLSRVIEKAGKINKMSAKKVGVGAVKYFDLKHSSKTSYKFDIEEALALDGDSGPYLQYSAVRCKSVLNKAGLTGALLHRWIDPSVYGLEKEEVEILQWLYRFPEVVEEAAVKYSPNLVCSYLIELARRFNGFYNKHRILNVDNLEKKTFRLSLTGAVEQVLENGLGLLGIEVPEKM